MIAFTAHPGCRRLCWVGSRPSFGGRIRVRRREWWRNPELAAARLMESRRRLLRLARVGIVQAEWRRGEGVHSGAARALVVRL